MSVVNGRRKGVMATSHRNFMDGESYDITPLTRLRTMAASCFFGEPAYYKRGASKPSVDHWYHRRANIGEREYLHLTGVLGLVDLEYNRLRRAESTKISMEKVIDAALETSVEETLKIAVSLRNEDLIRVTPQIILVRAANHKKSKGSGLIRKYAPQIVKRGDEPNTCIAYQLSEFGKPVPNALKRALADVMKGYNEYTIAKYRQDDREVSMKDVVRIVHPDNSNFSKLLKGDVKNTKTWEAIRSAGGTWEDAISNMGHMALLRNLRNFIQNEVPVDLYADKLVSGAKTGKQLPFRYLSAYTAVGNLGAKPGVGRVLSAIDECLMLSVENLPRLKGRTLSLADNSGSAWGAGPSELSSMKVAEIGNLMGVLTAKISDDGVCGVFGDRLETFPVKRTADVIETTKKLTVSGQGIGHATENGIWIALRDAIKNSEHWDNIFIYSDMQAGHGGLYGTSPHEYRDYSWLSSSHHIDVAKLVSKYRSTVNPKVNVFLVQIAGYGDTIIPEVYNRTYILGGWGSGLLSYASKMIAESNGDNRPTQ